MVGSTPSAVPGGENSLWFFSPQLENYIEFINKEQFVPFIKKLQAHLLFIRQVSPPRQAVGARGLQGSLVRSPQFPHRETSVVFLGTPPSGSWRVEVKQSDGRARAALSTGDRGDHPNPLATAGPSRSQAQAHHLPPPPGQRPATCSPANAGPQSNEHRPCASDAPPPATAASWTAPAQGRGRVSQGHMRVSTAKSGLENTGLAGEPKPLCAHEDHWTLNVGQQHPSLDGEEPEPYPGPQDHKVGWPRWQSLAVSGATVTTRPLAQHHPSHA